MPRPTTIFKLILTSAERQTQCCREPPPPPLAPRRICAAQPPRPRLTRCYSTTSSHMAFLKSGEVFKTGLRVWLQPILSEKVTQSGPKIVVTFDVNYCWPVSATSRFWPKDGRSLSRLMKKLRLRPINRLICRPLVWGLADYLTIDLGKDWL